jgi:hypothetical protein
MSQNNMVNFITLTDLDADKIELNPAFIAFMKRDTYEPEEGVEMPFTKVILSTNHHIFALETPEQIAQLQMDGIKNLMKSLMNNTINMFEELEKLEDEEQE